MLIPRMYFYITLGIFSLTSLAKEVLLLYYNITFMHSKENKKSRVRKIFKYLDNNNKSPI